MAPCYSSTAVLLLYRKRRGTGALTQTDGSISGAHGLVPFDEGDCFGTAVTDIRPTLPPDSDQLAHMYIIYTYITALFSTAVCTAVS